MVNLPHQKKKKKKLNYKSFLKFGVIFDSV